MEGTAGAGGSWTEQAERDVVAELASIRDYVKNKFGVGTDQPHAPTQVTPLRRLEEHLDATYSSLEQVVSGASLHKRWKGMGADSEVVSHEQEPED